MCALGRLTQDGGTVDPGAECGETSTLDPSRATGTSLDRTDVNGKRPSQRCTTSEQWQPGGVETDDGSSQSLSSEGRVRRLAAHSTREFHRDACQSVETVQRVDQTAGTTRSADYLSFLAEAEMKAVDPDQCLDMDDSIPDRDAAVLTGPRVRGTIRCLRQQRELAQSSGVPNPDTTRHWNGESAVAGA